MFIKLKNKEILDVACGGKMFWFNKDNPKVLFNDIREKKYELCDGRTFEIKPDTQMDFRDLDLPDEHFKLVIFDPPHLKNLGETSWMAKKYGKLSDNWEDDLKAGFEECWRVLRKDGLLVFKWNERDVKVSKVIEVFGREPLFGHTTGRSGKTKWMCYLKND
jgi:SAM-dependent methyltransferase